MAISGIIIAVVAFTAATTIEPIRNFLFGDLDDIEDRPLGEGLTISKRGSLENVPVIYGKRRTGGIINFKGTEGTNNENLWIEYIIAEGECNALVDMFIDGESYTESKYSGLVTLTFYSGTDSQAADPNLVAKFDDYTTDDRSRGLCKAVVKFKYNANHLTREPKVEFLIEGKKLYDTRTSTTAYSENPALAVYDYLTNARYGAGYKISASNLIDSDFNAAANYCETQIVQHQSTSSTTDYYQLNGVIDTGKNVRSNIIEMLSAFNAHLVPDGDKYRILVEKDESIALGLDHDNIIEDSVNYAINDIKDRHNEILLDYANEEKEYLDDQLSIKDATLLAEDNNIENQKRIKNYLDTDQYRLNHFIKIVMKKSRQGIAVGLTVSPQGFELLPGAIVSLTLSDPGWSNKTFRVLKTKEIENGNIGLNLLEHEPSVYDRLVPVSAPTPPDTYLPSPFVVEQVSGITAQSGDNYVILASSGDFVPRVYVTWTPLDNIYITHYEIQWKLNSGSSWIDSVPAIGKDANKQYIVGPQNDDLIDIRIRAVNARGVHGEWSQNFSHVVVGTTGVPPDVDNFTVKTQADGTRYATFSLNAPPIDLAGYKIRYSNNLAAVWSSMTDLHTGIITQSPFEFNLLDQGDWLLAIKAVDRGGRESANATFVSETLSTPRIGNIIYTESPRGQGWPGTKTGCYVDSSDNSLVADSTTTWSGASGSWDSYNNSWYFSTGTSFTYEHDAIDLGASLYFSVNIQATPALGSTVTVEESHSDDDVTYTSFASVAGPVQARYIKIKVTVSNSLDTPKLANLAIYLGGDSIVDVFTLLDTSTITAEPGGGVRIPLRSSFQKITDVNLSMHSVGSGHTWEIIDLDETNGPHVKMYNSSGTLVYPSVSVQILGV